MAKSNLSISLVTSSDLLTKFLIDYYLTSSEDFGGALKDVDAGRIMDSLESEEDMFNERLLKLICIN
jgi:hypothetical protein